MCKEAIGMTSTPFVKDKSHDPFIIYGGLFSRSLVEARLQSICPTSEHLSLLSEYVESISRHCPSEEHLRKQIAEKLLSGEMANLPPNSQGDILYQDVVIEVKNAVNTLDLDVLKGSIKSKTGRIETAEEELFRYFYKFKESSSVGVLTNGRSFRFYEKSVWPNYIEFDIFDVIASKATKHASLFMLLLRNSDVRKTLLGDTTKIRTNQIEMELSKRIGSFLKTSVGDKASALKLCIFMLMIRYLEDIGVLPLTSEEYRKTTISCEKHLTKKHLRQVVDDFYNGRWFKGQRQVTLEGHDVEQIKEALNFEGNISGLHKLLFDKGQPIDLSDIYIDHLGNIYQTKIHNHSEGAYYTPHSVGRKIAEYLRDLNRTTRNKFGEDENSLIIDPACGSGQLLRTLVPFSHYFFEHQITSVGKNSTRRHLISKLAGVDKDEMSVFICKIGMGLMGAESGFGLSAPKFIVREDTLQEFVNSRRNFGGIDRKNVFAIVTNPPWESLEFNVSNLYRRVTGNKLPKKMSLDEADSIVSEEKRAQIRAFAAWQKKNNAIIRKEQDRISGLQVLCDEISNEHGEYFKGKKNLALYFMFVVNKLLESSGGSYVVVMPDRFFVGDDCPLRDKIMPEVEAYVPFQNCGRIFEGVDNGTRFGILFGRKRSPKRKISISMPIIENGMPVDFVDAEIEKSDLCVSTTATVFGEEKRYTLPFFVGPRDAEILSSWLTHRQPLSSWEQGRINLGGRTKNPAFGKVGRNGQFNNRVVKSEKRKTTSSFELSGVLETQFGASVETVPERLSAHYKASKVVVPNVKRNGIRKIITEIAKDCLVEHDYNFNQELKKADLKWLRSLTYNHLVSILAGSYHVNAGVQNLLGKIEDDISSQSFVGVELELLKCIGFSEADAVDLVATYLLQGFPSDFISQCYSELETISKAFSKIEPERLLIPFKSSVGKQVVSLVKKRADLPDVRAQIAAYIVKDLASSPLFGRTKLEKALYLIEATGAIDLGGNYFREAAGPLDTGALYGRKEGIESLAKRKEYFSASEMKISGGRKLVVYSLLDRISEAEKAVEQLAREGYLDKKRLEGVLSVIRNMNAAQSEIVATLFAAWNDMLIDGREPTEQQIVREVRENWHEAKKKFSEYRLETAIKWMRKKNLVPLGIGPKTEKKSA